MCSHCKANYGVSRGSVYEDSKGFCIYLAGLHQCESGKTAHLAIAVQKGYKDFTETCSAAIQARNTGQDIEMSVVDAENSPWRNESYLGRILDRDEVLTGSLKDTFFHLADHIVIENPTIKEYLTTD